MTLPDCYAALGGDYDEVVSRLRSERLIQKFVLKFLDDGSYALLESSMAAHNREEAFRAAHTIKGMCQNLSFTALGKSADQLTEALRNDWGEDAPALFETVKADYARTTAAIESLKAALGL